MDFINESYEAGQGDAIQLLEKVGMSGKMKALIGAGALAGIGLPVGYVAAKNSDAARDSAKARARAAGIMQGQAAKMRDKNLFQYLTNPHVPGPLTEINSALKRRSAAADEDAPTLGMIPGYGMAVGGPAGSKSRDQTTKGPGARDYKSYFNAK